ncbi:hypothetical protein VVR12_01605 [Rothia sp. LK2588]|uniref:hypothetical protein n=1 Tax=Rothia sp. LK2588 TaxID=3114369 RepID=UPI0034CD1B24
MGTNKSTSPDAFALAVRSEVLAELGRRQITIPKLAELIPRKKSYLYDRLSQANRELTLTDIEYICAALGIPITPLMERAEDAMHIYRRDYALAAESDDQIDLDEGDMYA